MKLFPTSFILTYVVVGFLVHDSSARIRGIYKRPLVAGAVDKPLHVPNLDEHFRGLKAGGPGTMKMPAESFNKESKPTKQDKKKEKGAKSSGEKKNPKKETKEGSKSARGAEPKAIHEEAQLPEGGGEEEGQSESTTRAAKLDGGKAGKQSDNIDAIEETVAETEAPVEEFDGVLSVEDTSEAFVEADAADPEITKRSLTLLAIQYETSTNQIPASLDYIELARVTRHLLSNLFHWYYGNFQNIKYDLLEMHRYTVLAPTLVKFDVTLHFQEGDGVFVPTQADIQATIDEQLYEGSDYANLYLNRLRNSAFGIFTTTKSFRVIANGGDLEQLEEELNKKQGIEDFPNASGSNSWVNLVALLAFLVLSLLLCVALCTCCRRRRRRRLQRLERKGSESSQIEFRDPTDPDNDSTTGIPEYRTNMFSDQDGSLRSLQIAPQDDEKKLQDELEQVMEALEDVPLEDNEVPEVQQPPAKENGSQVEIAPAGFGKSPTNRPHQSNSTDPLPTSLRKIAYRANQVVTNPRIDVETLVTKPSWFAKATPAKPKGPESSITATSNSAPKVTTEVPKKGSPVASKPAWVVKSGVSASSKAKPVDSVRGTESVENTPAAPPKPAWAKKSSTESGKSDDSTSTNASMTSDKKFHIPPKLCWVKKDSSGSETSVAKSDADATNEVETAGKTTHAESLAKISVDSGKYETSDPIERTTMPSSTKPIWASKNFLKPVNRDGFGQNRLWAQQESESDPPMISKETPPADSKAKDTYVINTIPENQKMEPTSAEPVDTTLKDPPSVPSKTSTRNISSEEESKIQQSISFVKEKKSDVPTEPSLPNFQAKVSAPVKSSTADFSPVGLMPASREKIQTNTMEKLVETVEKASISNSNKPEAEGKPAGESGEPAVVASGSAPEWMMKFKQMGLQKIEE